MSKKKPTSQKADALVVLNDPQILPTGLHLADLQQCALRQMELISSLERDAALRAILVGLALHRIKAGLQHGEFLPWINANIGKSRKQCSFYMRLALVFVNSARVSATELLELPADNTDIALTASEGVARRFMEKAVKFVGDKSLNEILREHGIKDSGKLGGARTADEARDADAASDAEQLYLFARDEIGGVITAAESLLLKENRLQHLVGHPDEIRGVVESLRSLADKVEAAAKPFLKPAA